MIRLMLNQKLLLLTFYMEYSFAYEWLVGVSKMLHALDTLV